MKKIHVSTVTAAILASLTLISEVSATDIASPVFVKTGDADLPPALYLSYGSTNYWDMAGGSNNYRIFDHTNGNAVVRLYASSNNNDSINVDSSGDINLADGSVFIDRSANQIGIGTSIPAKEIHTVSSDTPTLRLEQDGSEGWPAQIWDIAANETSFYIHNVTNSNFMPFSIDAGAPQDSLAITSSGSVGIGTGIPTATLHVQGDIASTWSGSNIERDGTKYLVTLSADNSEADKTSDAGFALENVKEGFKWEFRTYEAVEGFTATKALTGGGEFVIENTTTDYHNAKMIVGGVTIFENGQLQTPSSRALKTDIKPLDTKAALDAFHKLQPVSYAYKAHKDEPVVGFIAEDIPDLVATKTRTGIDSTEIVAVLTKVVQEQDAEMKAMKAEIAELKIMKQKVAMMESILTNLALDTSNSKKEKVSLKLK